MGGAWTVAGTCMQTDFPTDGGAAQLDSCARCGMREPAACGGGGLGWGVLSAVVWRVGGGVYIGPLLPASVWTCLAGAVGEALIIRRLESCHHD